MKANEVRALGIEEINRQLKDAYKELFELTLKSTTRQLANHREIPRVKKQIAVLKTILRERELSEK
ncbi:MAG: 50S ribosomal protein L29 [Dehalococcoidales bacterium]|nr:50S ribosomal protein L29 [Dehalococcoidales bacterium]